MTRGSGNGGRHRLAVLVTCYNRVDTSQQTLVRLDKCLRDIPGVEATLFIVDDGSSDGTGARLKSLIPGIVLEYGTGDLFWNGGMCRAFEVARRHGDFDIYLLFNDDVFVDCEAVASAFNHYFALNAEGPAVLAGATRWHDRDVVSYSAFRRVSGISPLAVERVLPDGTLKRCDSFNGNFVLVPGPFFERVGGLDPKYRHTYGDIDLGYVAKANGLPIYLAPAPVGRCDGHAPASYGREMPRWLQRWVRPWPRGDDLAQRAHFIRKHTPPFTAPLLIVAVALSRLTVKAVGHLTRLNSERHQST